MSVSSSFLFPVGGSISLVRVLFDFSERLTWISRSRQLAFLSFLSVLFFGIMI
jgi:hypothetical protein